MLGGTKICYLAAGQDEPAAYIPADGNKSPLRISDNFSPRRPRHQVQERCSTAEMPKKTGASFLTLRFGCIQSKDQTLVLETRATMLSIGQLTPATDPTRQVPDSIAETPQVDEPSLFWHALIPRGSQLLHQTFISAPVSPRRRWGYIVEFSPSHHLVIEHHEISLERQMRQADDVHTSGIY